MHVLEKMSLTNHCVFMQMWFKYEKKAKEVNDV